ncbi:pilus assembly protein PilM [Microbacterium flavum]|uniref:Pilus assembly protein PilM n=1 Tax=Microbacterium flavum TaxID=415216 RepID=A0ABS5XR58_9MICO|nr:pilus assembly protein PilM [Microbacterium flavum]MBT8797015.1 pilus assembly protein PilM [Microbacterium flavum]
MAKTIVGLEITEEGVRAAEVTTGKTPTIVAYGAVPLPAGAAKDSEVFDTDAVVLAIRQLWSRAGITAKKVVLGIGSRRILVRDYTTQAMRPELLAQALPFQVQDLLPVPADQAVLDFYPVSQDGDQVTGLLVAAVAETVEDLVATVSGAKIDVEVVDLAPFALARAISRVASAGETVAALHLGDHTSYVVVVQNGIPRFVRIIPAEIMTAAVRAHAEAVGDADAPAFDEVLETVPSTADGPRLRRSGARGTAQPAAGMSRSAIDDIVNRLGSTLRFYGDRSLDAPVTRVLLSGAGAAVDGIPAALSASLPIPVQIIGASGVFDSRRGFDGPDDDLNLITTAALALEGDR